jgi:hypothetical protein
VAPHGRRPRNIRPAYDPHLSRRIRRRLVKNSIAKRAGTVHHRPWAEGARATLILSAIVFGLGILGFAVYGVIDLATPFTPSHIIWAASLWAWAASVTGVVLAGLIFVAPPASDVLRRWVLMIQQVRLNHHREAFVDPSELNQYCQSLLWRAQQAIDNIVGSKVVAADVIDHIRVTNLPEYEWKLARGLSEITKLQAKTPPDARQLDPESAGEATEQERLLEEARSEYARLVDSLENCSHQVTKADQAFLREQRKQQEADEDIRRALYVSSDHDRHIELRSNAERVSAAIDEIKDLADEATNLWQQLRDVEDQDG